MGTDRVVMVSKIVSRRCFIDEVALMSRKEGAGAINRIALPVVEDQVRALAECLVVDHGLDEWHNLVRCTC